MTDEKRLRMFAGPNGSGKSTVKEILPTSYLGHYLNPDDLEKQLNESHIFPIHQFGFGLLDSVAVKEFFLEHSLTIKANLQTTLSDRAYIFDNSGTSRIWVAEVTNGSEIEITYPYIPSWFANAVLDKQG